MSISPPTDIVLDVARAADPERFKVAAARLARLAETDAAGFDDALAEAAGRTKPAGTAAPAFDAPATTTFVRKPPAGAADAYRGFEAMALTTFIQSAMPDDGGSSYFGSGTAGSVWKSMLAQQIAEQMAKRGGIGIADAIAGAMKAREGGGAASALDAAKAKLGASFTGPLAVLPAQPSLIGILKSGSDT